ncbi:MAG: 4Fe-4S ferredoxin [Deltaproteobacteria bacterium]|nr:4Fe-4S ferredoxin [Deltaproteobacteria bacterium]
MIQEKLRQKARELLESKAVDLVIGFGEGSLPLRVSPVFIRNPHEVDRLVWNSFCRQNLSTYLHKFKSLKIGLVVKGCDSRSVVALSLEKRFKPDQLFLIGVPCQRMVDHRRVKRAVQGEILHVSEQGDELIVEGKDFKTRLNRKDFLYPSCQVCVHRNPVRADLLMGEVVEEFSLLETHPDMKGFLNKGVEERWDYFEKETGRCIRCYACREACPMCYCPECFVDNSNPKWMEQGLSPSDLEFYHIVRAYHQTGRCTACGACERACPMEIRLTYMTEKLNQDVKELFGFETGVDPQASSPLSTFDVEDQQEFIK